MKRIYLLFLLLCFSFKKVKLLQIFDEVLQSELVSRLAQSFYNEVEELKLIERALLTLNDTVNRLRCPSDWIRIGRSCYTGDIGLHSNLSSAHAQCVTKAAKPSEDGRVSLATLNNPLELHALVGLMIKTNINRVHLKMSPALTNSILLLHDKLDSLFMTNSKTSWFSNRRFCSSVSLQNPHDILTSSSMQKERTPMSNIVNTTVADDQAANSCFMLDFTSDSHISYSPTQTFNDEQSSSMIGKFDLPSDFENNNLITGRCKLFYNENCSCPDVCNYICKYSSDLCAMNLICGSHGRCVDTLKNGLKCECNFLYGGTLCDKITREGMQIIACMLLIVLVSFANSWILRSSLLYIIQLPTTIFKKRSKPHKMNSRMKFRNLQKSRSPLKAFRQRISDIYTFIKNKQFFHHSSNCKTFYFLRQLCAVICCGFGNNRNNRLKFFHSATSSGASRKRRLNSPNEGNNIFESFQQNESKLPGKSEACMIGNFKQVPLESTIIRRPFQHQQNQYKRRKLHRTIAVSVCTLLLTTILLSSTSITQLAAFRSDFDNELDLKSKLNRSLGIVKRCQLMTSFVQENLISFPFALLALITFAFFIKRDKYCRRCLNGRPGLPTPMEPFKMKNRFSTAIIFGLLACEVLKIFEELLFKTNSTQPLGILLDLSVRVGFVFLIGMRYYPLLASLQLRSNLICTGVACVYAWFDMIYVVVKQGFCMGFVPISSISGLVNEARLRLELGSWYVVYGLIRNAPHFACLAYVTSEFTTRFIEAFSKRTNFLSSLNHCGGGYSQDSCQLKLYEQDVRGYYYSRNDFLRVIPNDAVRARMPASYASCWDGIQDTKLMVNRTINEERFFSLAFTDSAPNHLYVRNLLRKRKHHSSVNFPNVHFGDTLTYHRHNRSVGRLKSIDRQYFDQEDQVTTIPQHKRRRRRHHSHHHHQPNQQYTFMIQTKLRKLLSSVYVWRHDFRYSTIAVCTFVTAFVFLYYLACTLAFYHLSRTEGHGFVLNFYFKHILNIKPEPAKKYLNLDYENTSSISNALTFWREICCASIFAYVVFAVQMFHSMKQYRANKLMMYKGIFEDIPSARHLEPSKMIAQSVHYSGFLIGYMAWGFIIVFYLALIVTCTVSILFRQRIEYIATAIAFLVPVFMIYALKILLVRSTSKAVFTQGFGSKMALNNRRIHAVFVYFNFFFDCFLGIVACLSRLFKSILLNVLFMARLDYSFVGRPLERLDPGFSTYVAFLHTEVAHTHPVMVAFCDMIWRQIVLRRVGLITNVNSSNIDGTTHVGDGHGNLFGINDHVGGDNSSIPGDDFKCRRFKHRGLPIIRPAKCERARFRWMLCYTLLRNGGLLSFRKNLTSRLQFIVTQRCKMHDNNIAIVSSYDGVYHHNHCAIKDLNSGVIGVINSHDGNDINDRHHSYFVAPSIRVYSTTGVGDLLACAGEKIHQKDNNIPSSVVDGYYRHQHRRLSKSAVEDNDEQENSSSSTDSSDSDDTDGLNGDETVNLLKTNDTDAVPLVFETAASYPTASHSAGQLIFHYLDNKAISYNYGIAAASAKTAAKTTDATAHGTASSASNTPTITATTITDAVNEDNSASAAATTTVLRVASYSERDALWRQGVRERVCNKSRFRYHYGCLNQLPAVKVLDLAHYRHMSLQQQRHILEQNSKGRSNSGNRQLRSGSSNNIKNNTGGNAYGTTGGIHIDSKATLPFVPSPHHSPLIVNNNSSSSYAQQNGHNQFRIQRTDECNHHKTTDNCRATTMDCCRFNNTNIFATKNPSDFTAATSNSEINKSNFDVRDSSGQGCSSRQYFVASNRRNFDPFNISTCSVNDANSNVNIDDDAGTMTTDDPSYVTAQSLSSTTIICSSNTPSVNSGNHDDSVIPFGLKNKTATTLIPPPRPPPPRSAATNKQPNLLTQIPSQHSTSPVVTTAVTSTSHTKQQHLCKTKFTCSSGSNGSLLDPYSFLAQLSSSATACADSALSQSESSKTSTLLSSSSLNKNNHNQRHQKRCRIIEDKSSQSPSSIAATFDQASYNNTSTLQLKSLPQAFRPGSILPKTSSSLSSQSTTTTTTSCGSSTINRDQQILRSSNDDLRKNPALVPATSHPESQIKQKTGLNWMKSENIQIDAICSAHISINDAVVPPPLPPPPAGSSSSTPAVRSKKQHQRIYSPIYVDSISSNKNKIRHTKSPSLYSTTATKSAINISDDASNINKSPMLHNRYNRSSSSNSFSSSSNDRLTNETAVLPVANTAATILSPRKRRIPALSGGTSHYYQQQQQHAFINDHRTGRQIPAAQLAILPGATFMPIKQKSMTGLQAETTATATTAMCMHHPDDGQKSSSGNQHYSSNV
ncbi:hypothetical protein GJ496_007339 [Pomphorhynchus laevis]|nr:hypothetical protein GJ496_007339 [Pomphorhynchus laevis]